MPYLLFPHPQQREANKLNKLINLIIIFTHRWKTQTMKTNKQFNAFDVNIATFAKNDGTIYIYSILYRIVYSSNVVRSLVYLDLNN